MKICVKKQGYVCCLHAGGFVFVFVYEAEDSYIACKDKRTVEEKDVDFSFKLLFCMELL